MLQICTHDKAALSPYTSTSTSQGLHGLHTFIDHAQVHMMDCSAGVADRLSLRPVFPAIQRVAVYETRTVSASYYVFQLASCSLLLQRLYVVGSTNDGKSCRVLKIDRTVAPNMGLAIEEDEKEYQQEEVCVCEL